MSSVPAFVSELIRAANHVRRLSPTETGRLLSRAIMTVRDLRDTIGIPVDGTDRDAINRLTLLVSTIEEASQEEIRMGLLASADMVRTLWIVVDSGTEIGLTPSA
ncbi:hypothetical protein FHX06_007153 [Rhizobium sp. BK512]|uniref:hypothetical protein n=1 Tax=Rhizobium sp. BK512 TaxID=2587010 RepID=UPI0016221E38|nr:hypothetical protein [Rhizobium sp. BK512]MBB3565780.1 hypothetical protein [Rhizobium sp. BK512]